MFIRSCDYYRSAVRNISSIRCGKFVVSANRFLWLEVFLVMLGLSDYARLFVPAVDKEKTSRGPAVTRNETTVDQTVVSGVVGRIACHLIFTVWPRASPG
jgi:hypothetical protein